MLTGNEISIQDAIDTLVKFSNRMTQDQMQSLMQITSASTAAVLPSVAQDAFSMDLIAEAAELKALVTKLRKYLSTQSLAEDSVGELSKLISTSTTLFTLLMKHQRELINMDRLRKIEVAVCKALEELPAETQQVFFGTLEELLRD